MPTDHNIASKYQVIDGSRQGFPEPSLLPHLAKYVPFENLAFLLYTAHLFGGGGGFQPWPRLLFASCEIVAKRIDEQPHHPEVKEILAEHSCLYDFIGIDSIEVAIDATEKSTGYWSPEQRANKLCRLAGRFPNYENGVLIDLASAAMLDLTGSKRDRNDSWYLSIATPDERQKIIQKLLGTVCSEILPTVALFANASHQERALLTDWLLKIDDHGAPNEIIVAIIATVLPQANEDSQAQLSRFLLKHLQLASSQQPEWWLALVMSHCRNLKLSIDLKPLDNELSPLSSEWVSWIESFEAEDLNHEMNSSSSLNSGLNSGLNSSLNSDLNSASNYADVMRAHIGISDPIEIAKLKDLAEQHAEELLDQIMSRWGGSGEVAMVGGDSSGTAQPAQPVTETMSPPVAAAPPSTSTAPSAASSGSASNGGQESAARSGAIRGLGRVIGGVGGAIGGLLDGIFGGGRSRDSEAPAATRGPIGGASRGPIGGASGGAASSPASDTIASDTTAAGTLPADMSVSEPRRLQADVSVADRPEDSNQNIVTSAFLAGKKYAVAISVGRGASLQIASDFDETIFVDNPNSESETLDLRFIYQGSASSGNLELPRDETLNSNIWIAEFVAPADETELNATVVVLHKGRVLQTAGLSGQVVSSENDIAPDHKIKFTLTADVHDFSDLDQREPFDASIVTDGDSGAAFAGASIGVSDLKGVDATIDRMTNKLFKTSEAITIAGEGGDPTKYEQLLVYMAANGKVLHSKLIRQLMPSLETAQRIQIVSTNPSAILPLEFIYSGPSPKHDAKLCADWAKSLEIGHCSTCQALPAGERADTICPLSFWALSKVIERHAPNQRRADGHDFLVDTQPSKQRKKLAPFDQALFSASDNVPEHLVDSTLDSLRSMLNKCDDARTWLDWKANIDANSPSLLVSMPHNALEPVLEISTLEIGRGNDVRAGEVGPEYVFKEGSDVRPVVLLLGCQTAVGGAQPFHSFVGEFRDSGASIVVGTLATVLAEHAAPIVQSIVRELTKPTASNRNTVGDLLLGIRREMFAQGILISLAVASFGDADWELAQPGE